MGKKKVQTRQDLLYLLSQASELEHSLACQYLYAAFSLKKKGDPGITDEQAALTEQWRGTIIGIAVQEMLHLGLATNLLTAIGGAPFFRRANFPQGKMYTTLGLDFRLAGVTEKTIKRFCCFELPPELKPESVYASWKCTCRQLVVGDRSLVAGMQPLLPQIFDYKSIGELYDLIETGFKELYPEDASKLFIGMPRSQTTAMWKTMTAVTNRKDASIVIDLILRQGEGAYGCDREIAQAHFGKFVAIHDAIVNGDAGREPAFNVVDNPALVLHHDMEYDIGGEHICPTILTSSLAREGNEIFVSLYELALQILMRFFANTEETEEQRYVLMQAFLSLMRYCITPLGTALARVPAFESNPDGQRAGASFEVYADTMLLPHLSSSWLYFEERLNEIAAAASELAASKSSQQYQILIEALTGDNTVNNPGVYAVCLKYALGISAGRRPPSLWTWDNGVRAFFTPLDVQRMISHGIDLSSEKSVRDNKKVISDRIDENASIRMPPQYLLEDETPRISFYRNPYGPWTSERIDVFRTWAEITAVPTFVCPEPLTWEGGVKNFFTARDAEHMLPFGFDLSVYGDVLNNLDRISGVIESKFMPPGGGWPDDQIACFVKWKNEGAPEGETEPVLTWRRTSAPTASSRYDDVYFINNEIGWAVNSNAQVMHTRDSGETWNEIALISNVEGNPIYLRCCMFVNENIGYIGTISGKERLWKSTDGGSTWIPFQNLPAAAPLKVCGLFALSENVVYGTGTNEPEDYAAFVKTTDGGKTWTARSLEDQASILIDNYFWDEMRGIVVGGYTDVPREMRVRDDLRPVILRTDDGGVTWTNLLADFTSRFPRGEWGWKICIVSDDVIYVALENLHEGAIAKTIDGGKTWVRLPINDGQGTNGNANLEGIGFINEEKGWVGGWGNAAFTGGYTSATVDGGATWTAATEEVGQFINRFRFLGDPVNLGFASGDTIYKYSAEPVSKVAETVSKSCILSKSDAFHIAMPVVARIMVPENCKKLRFDMWNHFGNFVQTIVNENMPAAGERNIVWDGKDCKGRKAKKDAYIYRVTVDCHTESRTVFVDM